MQKEKAYFDEAERTLELEAQQSAVHSELSLLLSLFPKRPNFAALKEHNIIREAPRGFDELPDDAFMRLVGISHANKNLIID